MDNLHSLSRRFLAVAAAGVIAVCGGTSTASAAGESDEVGVKMSLLAGGSAIGMKFRIDTTENIGDLTVTVDDKGVSPDTSGAFALTEYSMDMGKEHKIVVKKGSAILTTKSASVAGYLNEIKTNEAYEDIASAMLLYGGASQEYFGSDDASVSSGVSATQYSEQEIDGIAFDKEAFNDDLAGKAVSFYGMNLSLKDRTTFTLFFKKSDTATIDEAEEFLNGFTFGDEEVTAAKNGSSFLTVSAVVPATKLMDTIELTNGSVSANFAPVQYIAAAQNAGDEKLAAVCKALYAYGLAASDFTEPAEPSNDPEPLLEPKGTVHSGLATQYVIENFGEGEGNLGQAMLGDMVTDGHYAALSTEDYNTAMLAGAYIEVTYGNSTTKAYVVDTFGGDNHDKKGNVDLGPKAFKELNSVAQGDIEVTWKIIPYEKEHMNYRFKDGASQWHFEMQILDHKYPIYRLEAEKDGQWIEIPRAIHNYFKYTDGLGEGPYKLRITDIYGHVVEDTVPLKLGEIIEGNAQFPD